MTAAARTIRASLVREAAATAAHPRAVDGPIRWAAMSDGCETDECRPRPLGEHHWRVPQPSRLLPLNRGGLANVVQRVILRGRYEVIATWRTRRLSELFAELATHTLRRPA